MPVNTRQVGVAFQAGKPAQGHGSIRCEHRNGLTIGYSYAEPVAIHDGRRTLRTIDSWSVTTSGHLSAFGVVGSSVPSTAQVLRRIAQSCDPVEFGRGVAIGERALTVAADRMRPKGVPVDRVGEGVYEPQYAYRTDVCRIARGDGGRWYVYIDGVIVGMGKTLREARVAAWTALGIEPMPGIWNVTFDDMKEAIR